MCVSELKRNLISVGALDAHRCIMKVESVTIRVIRGVMSLIRGVMKNGMM